MRPSPSLSAGGVRGRWRPATVLRGRAVLVGSGVERGRSLGAATFTDCRFEPMRLAAASSPGRGSRAAPGSMRGSGKAAPSPSATSTRSRSPSATSRPAASSAATSTASVLSNSSFRGAQFRQSSFTKTLSRRSALTKGPSSVATSASPTSPGCSCSTARSGPASSRRRPSSTRTSARRHCSAAPSIGRLGAGQAARRPTFAAPAVGPEPGRARRLCRPQDQRQRAGGDPSAARRRRARRLRDDKHRPYPSALPCDASRVRQCLKAAYARCLLKDWRRHLPRYCCRPDRSGKHSSSAPVLRRDRRCSLHPPRGQRRERHRPRRATVP